MPPQGPRMRRASCMSRCMMVTRFACIAHRFLHIRGQPQAETCSDTTTYVSSNRWTRYASVASCSARIAELCHRRPVSP